MGDRAMCQIKMEEGSLYIYTHNYGGSLPQMAREAVEKAKIRLSNESYYVRILVDQLTKDGRDEERGFGLMLKPRAEDEYNDGEPSVIIDASTGIVTVLGSHEENDR